MSRVLQPGWARCAGRTVGTALRGCAAGWLVFYLVYTPIHLHLEPHSDEADLGASAGWARAMAVAGQAGRDSHGHHERHPAAQHQFKGTLSVRLTHVQMWPGPAVEWVERGEEGPRLRAYGFFGLSPPELLRCWQFLLRAALPVRAPSLLS